MVSGKRPGGEAGLIPESLVMCCGLAQQADQVQLRDSVGGTPTEAVETTALVRLRMSVHRRVEVPLWRASRHELKVTASWRQGVESNWKRKDSP
jgi:hypothetical protein